MIRRGDEMGHIDKETMEFKRDDKATIRHLISENRQLRNENLFLLSQFELVESLIVEIRNQAAALKSAVDGRAENESIH